MYAQNKETRNNTRTFDDTQSPSNLDVEAKQEFAFSIIIDSLDRKKYSDASDKDEKFESLIIEKAELWEDYFQKYLYSCIEKMKLNKIEMPEGSRARAIDIYENMNMGGLSLSTLDLVAARVAKVSRESLYDRISKCLINNKKYNEAAFPKEIRRYIPLNYNASTKIKAVDTRASKSCSGLFLEVLGLYCNNKNYDPGGRVIPGASTIHFDEISRKRIFQAIDNANFSDIKLIRENYTNLKNKLGHIPALADFDKYGEMDVLRIFDNNSLGSYYKFLVKYEKEYTIRLSEDEEKAIEFISKKLASGKRIHELELLKRTLQYHHGIIGRLRKHLSEKYQCEMDEHCTENVVNMMTNEFSMSAAKKTYAQCVFLKKEQDDYGISDVYGKMLQNPEFCAILEELVDFGISRYKVNYSYHYQDTNLVLYQKYTYEDACRLLNWERNEVPLNIGGYKYDKKTKTFPIFINYDKQDNISDTTKYEDHFVAENRLIAISKSGRSMDSEDVQNFLKATERGIDVQLFVRKNKDDKISKEFYYLGRVIATGNAKQFVIPNTDKTAVEIEWELETPVREDIYQYIVNE